MKQVFINYVVHQNKVKENEALIQSVFRELHEQKPEGINYTTYKMGENVFVHIARFQNEESDKRFSNLPAFKNFRKNMDSRLEEKPIVNDVEEIGSYSAIG